MKLVLSVVAAAAALASPAEGEMSSTNAVADLGTVLVEGSALSRYRPETVEGATFSGLAPESSPTVVDTLTEDFIREHNPTDLHDLMRYVPGIETGGKSLLVRQPGTFTIRGMGGSEPAFDGVVPIGLGPGLFMDPFLMERVEIVKGPIGSLSGGAGSQQNNSGAGGSVNMYLKSASFRGDAVDFQENTSVGRDTWRQRGMIDANGVYGGDAFALRLIGALDFYSPAYCGHGSQKFADPRESYTFAPSFAWRPADNVTFGVKTMFQRTEQPSYIGIPVWRGSPGGGYGWYESSCRKGDRSKYESMYVNPYVDWQVTDDWLLKLGGAFMFSDWEQTTREPYMNNAELANYYETGTWSSGEKYMTSGFSQSDRISRGYNLYLRSVHTKAELPWGFSNTLLVQPDFYYRESTSGFGGPVARYGATFQDSVGWGWVTLLGGVRVDYFRENANSVESVNPRTRAVTRTHYEHCDETAVSPRAGLTVRPLDWLVLFGNLSQTRTPTLGYRDADGSRPTDPWRATQWEGGVRVRPVDRLWLSASYYRIDQENTPVAETVNGATYYYFEGKSRSQGAELSLAGDITENWTVLAMYSYNRYENRTAGASPSVFRRAPNHTFSLSTSYRFDCCDLLRDVVVGAGYRFRSKSFATMRGTFVDDSLYFDHSHVFDVNVSMPLSKFGGPGNWTITLGVRNLFGEKYFESARHFYECLAGEPRTFEIGLRARF
ncbi:MAG: TonB-dependent receptor [Kiritimatiellae bacterium]|nr:TonB-dependent receptor [Kiritimatiellia bacterium]